MSKNGVARPVLPLLLLERRHDVGVVGLVGEFRTWHVGCGVRQRALEGCRGMVTCLIAINSKCQLVNPLLR